MGILQTYVKYQSEISDVKSGKSVENSVLLEMQESLSQGVLELRAGETKDEVMELLGKIGCVVGFLTEKNIDASVTMSESLEMLRMVEGIIGGNEGEVKENVKSPLTPLVQKYKELLKLAEPVEEALRSNTRKKVFQLLLDYADENNFVTLSSRKIAQEIDSNSKQVSTEICRLIEAKKLVCENPIKGNKARKYKII
ncbi:hypothetical protein COB57_04590 [Candidatus Peregrinibacteria bacterium]|nr:MAG: hypothetical protein COB57_04590 [Candidatus Peregrinibacteria bacterium]